MFDAEHIAVANIASPGTAKNIEANPKVCLTFIHVFAQKGYKIKGQAINILAPSYTYYSETSVADQVIAAK